MYKIIGADGREYGPASLAQVQQWLAEGRLNAQTRILAPGALGWRSLAELPEIGLLTSQSAFRQSIPSFTRTNSFAVTGLVLGIVSLVLSFCCCGGLPLNLAGLVFSAVGLAQINRQPEVYHGKGVAIAGLITSGLSLIFGLGILGVSVIFNWDEIMREFNTL